MFLCFIGMDGRKGLRFLLDRNRLFCVFLVWMEGRVFGFCWIDRGMVGFWFSWFGWKEGLFLLGWLEECLVSCLDGRKDFFSLQGRKGVFFGWMDGWMDGRKSDFLGNGWKEESVRWTI